MSLKICVEISLIHITTRRKSETMRTVLSNLTAKLLDSSPEWIYQRALPLVYKILNAPLPPAYTCIIRCLIFAKFLGPKLCFIFVYICISVILMILTISFCSYLPFVITVNFCSYFCPFGHWQFSRSILLLCKLLRVS